MFFYAVQLTQGIQYVAFALMFGGMLVVSRKNQSLRWIFGNYLLGSIGLIFNGERAHEPAWLSNVAGLEIPQIRYGLLHAALVCFVGHHRATRWVAVALALLCLPFYLAWSGTGYADPAFAQRNFALLALALAIQTGLSAWLLMRYDDEATRLPRIVMSGFLLVYCGVEVVRLILTFWTVPALAAAMDSLSAGFFLLISSVTPVAFIWLLNARLLEDLQRQSILDPLTQLLNRRGLRKVSERELARYDRSRRSFALAIADIDHFKLLNDTHGHAGGDAILHDVAIMLQELVRRGDAVARIGGEEFVIFLPETDPSRAMPMVERLREAIADHIFTIGEAPVRVTVSFGVTASNGRDDLSLDGLVNEADSALYEAKQAGRNCSRLYESPRVVAETA